jgi:hypothetical protein
MVIAIEKSRIDAHQGESINNHTLIARCEIANYCGVEHTAVSNWRAGKEPGVQSMKLLTMYAQLCEVEL